MIFTSIFLLRAFNELVEAWEWYEGKQMGLGDRLKFEVYKRINEIEQHPLRYTVKKRNNREIKIKDFPYLIIYRINKKQHKITIISIFHTSRNPSKKYN